MDVREKLVELLKEVVLIQECSFGDPRPTYETVARYLIAHGVMVPPCKVGQTIYYLFQYSNKRILPFVRMAKVKRIYCGNPKMKFLVDGELKNTQEKGIIKTWCFDDFGKTVFLTKEEAEAALAKMDGERKDNE